MSRPYLATILGTALALSVCSAALAASDDDDDDDGWSAPTSQTWRGRGDDRRWRDERSGDEDRRGRGMGDRGGMHGMMPMRGHGAAHFMLRSGETRLAVVCSPNESMRACVEAATQLMDRASRLPGTNPAEPANPAAPGTGKSQP